MDAFKDTIFPDLGAVLRDVEEWKMFDAVDQVHVVFPYWILSICDSYAPEYDYLNENWKNLCAQWDTTPKQILIVKAMPEGYVFDGFRVMERVINLLTKNGFVIRTPRELQACTRCKKIAILSHGFYQHLLRLNRLVIPETWTELCKKCEKEKHDLFIDDETTKKLHPVSE